MTNRLMPQVILGVVVLNLLGFFMDTTWNRGEAPGYFSYDIICLDGFPYWLFATLAYLLGNGIASFYYADLRVQASAINGHYQGELPWPPFKLLGINLVLIPGLLFLFILIRYIGI